MMNIFVSAAEIVSNPGIMKRELSLGSQYIGLALFQSLPRLNGHIY